MRIERKREGEPTYNSHENMTRSNSIHLYKKDSKEVRRRRLKYTLNNKFYAFDLRGQRLSSISEVIY